MGTTPRGTETIRENTRTGEATIWIPLNCIENALKLSGLT